MTVFSNGLRPFSMEASGDLSTKQYHGIKINSSSQVEPVSSINDAFVGVLQTVTDTQGRAVSIASKGRSKAIAGAVVIAGAELECNSVGRFITLTSGRKVGTAMNGASAAGVEFTINLDAQNLSV